MITNGNMEGIPKTRKSVGRKKMKGQTEVRREGSKRVNEGGLKRLYP